MPAINPIERYLVHLHARFQGETSGAIATYIPELANASPGWFGICLATADGHVYEVGDSRQRFTVQSISKPFVYGLALEDRGKAAVLERIGVEPTGDAFNQISLEPHTGRPRNPMINAGAIAAASMVAGHSQADRWDRVLGLFGLYCGRALELNEAVYESERITGHRNRAISHMLRNAGILTADPEPDLDLYFRQCSIDVTTRDLAVMAATLATGGINPVTRERALARHNVDEVLSVMTTCGMYDYAGEWFYRVGFPAKSGVSGGILAVLPGQFGIGVFSPPLDARGNSVRGVAVCAALSDDLELHSLRAPRAALSALRTRSTLVHTRSKRVRTEADQLRLAERGSEAVVYQLQGDLGFAAAELVARRLNAERTALKCVVLDFTRVTEVDTTAARLLCEMTQGQSEAGKGVALIGLHRHPRMRRLFDETRATEPGLRFTHVTDLDAGVEWCEQRLLHETDQPHFDADELPFDQHPLLAGLAACDIVELERHMRRHEYQPNQTVVRQGEPADALFLIVRGELSVLVDDLAGAPKRISTLSRGMSFGEPALLGHALRSATVRADRICVCWLLSSDIAAALRVDNPRLAFALLDSVLRSSWTIVERLSSETVVSTVG